MRVSLEELIVSQLVRKYSDFHGVLTFIIAFTTTVCGHHLSKMNPASKDAF
jgi:hypothetical protein